LVDVGLCDLDERHDDLQWPLGRIVNDIVGLLGLLSRQQPVVLAIEDIHKACPFTLSVLEQLSFRSGELPLWIILTRRSHVEDPPFFSTIKSCLGPLFVRTRLGPLSASSPEFVSFASSHPGSEWILKNAAGNPFLMGQYLAADKNSTDIPPTVRMFLADLSAHLPSAARNLTQTLSVFEGLTPPEILFGLSELNETEFLGTIRQLEELRIISTTGGIHFTHYHLRQLIYSQIPAGARRRLHQAAFRLLSEKSFAAPCLADHAFRGRLFKEALSLYQRSATNSRLAGKYESALKSYLRMQMCAKELSEAMDSADEYGLAVCFARTGSHSKADTIFARLLSKASVQKDRELLSSVYAAMAEADHKNSTSDRLHLANLAIEVLPEDSPQLTLRYLQLWQAALRQGYTSTAVDALELAESNWDSCRDGDTLQFLKSARERQ
jgi:hypothetical protein